LGSWCTLYGHKKWCKHLGKWPRDSSTKQRLFIGTGVSHLRTNPEDKSTGIARRIVKR
jgi:hypothetical protein